MATVTGINGSRYYVNNPIWVTVDTSMDVDPTAVVNLSITINATIVFSAKYYPLNGLVYFDLSEIIKGFLPEPSHPTNPISGQPISLSTVNATISLPGFNSTKTFFRGGEDSQRTNIQVPNEAVLSESEKIPVWTGYPYAKYYLNSSGITYYTDILQVSEIEQRKVATCNPVYLRFLNSKGGYSFWLFEDWELLKNSKTTSVIERRTSDLDLGLETSHELNISTRVEERYLSTLRALLQSPDVYIYNIQNILVESNPQFQQSFVWTKIYNGGGNMKWNSYDSVHEFDFKFDLRLKSNPTLIW